MTIQIANSMLRLSKDEDSWNIIAKNPEPFIWDDNGFHIEKWNQLAGDEPGIEHVTVQFVEGEGEFQTYKGQTIQARLVYDRVDGLISIHALNKLVRSDSELRYCVDSYHSSDKAFLALSPAQWQKLEEEFGLDGVGYRFLKLDDDFNTFYEVMNSDEHCREYKSNLPPVDPQSIAHKFPKYDAAQLEWMNVQHSNQEPNELAIAGLIEHTIGTEEVNVLVQLRDGKTAEEVINREKLVKQLLPFVGHAEI